MLNCAVQSFDQRILATFTLATEANKFAEKGGQSEAKSDTLANFAAALSACLQRPFDTNQPKHRRMRRQKVVGSSKIVKGNLTNDCPISLMNFEYNKNSFQGKIEQKDAAQSRRWRLPMEMTKSKGRETDYHTERAEQPFLTVCSQILKILFFSLLSLHFGYECSESGCRERAREYY